MYTLTQHMINWSFTEIFTDILPMISWRIFLPGNWIILNRASSLDYFFKFVKICNPICQTLQKLCKEQGNLEHHYISKMVPEKAPRSQKMLEKITVSKSDISLYLLRQRFHLIQFWDYCTSYTLKKCLFSRKTDVTWKISPRFKSCSSGSGKL